MTNEQNERQAKMSIPDPSSPLELYQSFSLDYSKTPFRCPVCNGQGTVSKPPHIAGDQDTWVASDTDNLFQCPACGGTGIIWSEDEKR